MRRLRDIPHWLPQLGGSELPRLGAQVAPELVLG